MLLHPAPVPGVRTGRTSHPGSAPGGAGAGPFCSFCGRLSRPQRQNTACPFYMKSWSGWPSGTISPPPPSSWAGMSPLLRTLGPSGKHSGPPGPPVGGASGRPAPGSPSVSLGPGADTGRRPHAPPAPAGGQPRRPALVPPPPHRPGPECLTGGGTDIVSPAVPPVPGLKPGAGPP